MHHWILRGLVLLLASAGVWADDGIAPLPDPLTLDDALRLADPDVPLVTRAFAATEAAQATQLEAAALEGAQVQLKGSLRMINPSNKSTNDKRNDSQAHLTLRRRLYDFGYSTFLQAAADRASQASELALRAARQQRVLDVMRAFFDVILADLRNARDNEAMSVAFVAADKARDRNELGQLSDVKLLELEAAYQEARGRQLLSSQQQRLSRSRLAIAMGRPGELVTDLETPVIKPQEEAGRSFEGFWEAVKKGNPDLAAARIRLQAAQHELEAARASDSAVISAELDAAVYSRNTASTHPLGGGLVLELPLYTGGRKAAAIRKAQAALSQARADLAEVQQDLYQEALRVWLERARLRSELQVIQAEGDYRDLYLDRSRALYELEVRTDLGDAMTKISEVRLKHAQVLFDWAMNEARIKSMTGRLLEETK